MATILVATLAIRQVTHIGHHSGHTGRQVGPPLIQNSAYAPGAKSVLCIKKFVSIADIHFFLFFVSQGGQLVGLMPVLAACHLMYFQLYCIVLLFILWRIKFSLSLSLQFRALRRFSVQDAGLLTLTDLNLVTRPCRRWHDHMYYRGLPGPGAPG